MATTPTTRATVQKPMLPIWNPGHRSKKSSPKQTHSNPFKKHIKKKIITGANPLKKNHHLCKQQQQFFDQNPNTNTSWIPLFLAEREKKHKHKNSNTLIKTHLTVSTNTDGASFLQNLNPNPKTLENGWGWGWGWIDEWVRANRWMGEGEASAMEMGEGESSEKFWRGDGWEILEMAMKL